MFQQFFLFTTTSWVLGSFLTLPLLAGFYLCLRKKELIWRRDFFVFLFFEIFFILSFWFRFQPYGYNELIAFTVGPLLFLFFQQKKIPLFVQKYATRISVILSFIGGIISFPALVFFIFEHFSRLSGIFKGTEAYSTYPNTFAFFLIMILPFSFFLAFFVKKGLWQRVLSFLFLGSQLTAFFLTFSRGATISFFTAAIVCSFLLIHFYRKKRTPLFLIKKGVIFACTLIVIFGFSFTINELHRYFQPPISQQVPLTEDIAGRFSDRERSADQSTDERLQFWTNSFKLIVLSPWFGIGSDGFRFQYPRFQTELLATSTHPHNLFLKIAVENGIPAAFFLFAFFAIIGIGLFSQLLKEKNEKHFCWKLALLFAFLGALLHSQMDYNLNAMLPWLLFWLVISHIPLDFKTIKIRNPGATFSYVIIMAGTLGLFVLSLLYAWNYHLIKEAQKSFEAGDNKNLEHLMAHANPFPFEPLRYELVSEYVRKVGHDASTFAYPSVLVALEHYPDWAELKIVNARLLFAEGKFLEAVEMYEQALALNNFNNFSWHVEYIHSLLKAGFIDRIKTKEDFYFSLITSFTQKLQRNEHNTVATSNPAEVYRLILLYIQISPLEQKHNWYKLLADYLRIWQQERSKFEELFQLSLPY